MNKLIELDPRYSTTRRVIKADSQDIVGFVNQSRKPKDKFETLLFMPAGENRQGEGGLRTKGYFKVGGLISEASVIPKANFSQCAHDEISHNNDTRLNLTSRLRQKSTNH